MKKPFLQNKKYNRHQTTNKKYSLTDLDINSLLTKLNYSVNEKYLVPSLPVSYNNMNTEWKQDFHGMNLYEVKTWLFCELLEYYNAGFTNFVLIHGYNRGTVIRYYLRNEFPVIFTKTYPQLKFELYPEEQGMTRLFIQ